MSYYHLLHAYFQYKIVNAVSIVFFTISFIKKLLIILQHKHNSLMQKVNEARKRHKVSKTTEVQTKLFSGPTKKWSKEKVILLNGC